MKNITFFSSQGMEDTSGFGRCFPIAKELVKKGFNVNILAVHADYASVKKKKYTKDGVSVHYVGQMHVLKKKNKKYYFGPMKLLYVVLFSMIKMCFYGLRLKTDIIYCFKPQPVNGTAALLVKLFKRKPLLIDCDDYEASSSKLSQFKLFIFTLFENTMPIFAERISNNTHFIKEHLIKAGINPNKFVYIPDGVDWDRLKTEDRNKTEELKHKLQLEGKKVILYFGTVSMNFGHSIDLLIKAFPLVKEQVPEAKLLIVGGGDCFEEAQKLVDSEVKDDVIFTGRVSFEDFPYYIKLGHVSVDPVRNDIANKARYALKIVESIAMGLPLVTSDIGDRKIALENGRVGLFVKIGNINALAEGLISILQNDKLRAAMSQNCKKVIKTHHWDYLVNKFVKNTPCLKYKNI